MRTFAACRSLKSGDTVTKGQMLTDGSADLQELFKYAGKEKRAGVHHL